LFILTIKRPTQSSNVSVGIYRKTAYNWLDDSKKSVFHIVLSVKVFPLLIALVAALAAH